MGSRFAPALLSLTVGCASARPTLSATEGSHRPPAAPAPIGTDEHYRWASETRSPRRCDPRALEAMCGEADEALRRVAERIARRSVEGGHELDSPELAFAVRAEGVPYVWPKVWTLAGSGPEVSEVAARWRRWLGTFAEGGVRRCGAAELRDHARVIVVGVVCDVLADLSPLPTTARVGQWLTLDASLLSAAHNAEVVLLGPRGLPRAVPTSLYRARARASFSVDRPGPWMAQVLAVTEQGPRPVAEAAVYVGGPPPTSFRDSEAPGERPGAPTPDLALALEQMINSARATEQLGTLRRERVLDELALAHAETMAKAKLLAHDAGDGDPATRAAAAGLAMAAVGENVAHASSVPRAHRALWSSPSHRGNLLFPRFDSLGIGVVRDADGSVWVCELFANR